MSKYSDKRQSRFNHGRDASENGAHPVKVGVFHTAPMPEGATSARISGQTMGLLVGHDPESGETKTCLVQIFPPYVPMRSAGEPMRPATLSTTGLFKAQCEWCGPVVHTAASLVRAAEKKPGFKRGAGAKAAMALVTTCPQCGKPFKSGFSTVTPDDPDAAAVFSASGDPDEGIAWVRSCIERTKAAPSSPIEMPAFVGLWPKELGYGTRLPYTQGDLAMRAAENASTVVVRTKSGRTFNGLDLVDVEQVPSSDLVPPCGWYLVGPRAIVGEADMDDVAHGIVSGTNFRISLKILFGHRGGGVPFYTMGDALDGVVI